MQLTSRCRGADDDHVAHAQALALTVMQGLAGGEPGDGAEQHRERDADDDEGEQGLLAEETGRKGAGDDNADAGPQDRAQLVGSDTDAALDVAASEADGHRPHDGTDQRQRGDHRQLVPEAVAEQGGNRGGESTDHHVGGGQRGDVPATPGAEANAWDRADRTRIR